MVPALVFETTTLCLRIEVWTSIFNVSVEIF